MNRSCHILDMMNTLQPGILKNQREYSDYCHYIYCAGHEVEGLKDFEVIVMVFLYFE